MLITLVFVIDDQYSVGKGGLIIENIYEMIDLAGWEHLSAVAFDRESIKILKGNNNKTQEEWRGSLRLLTILCPL